MASLTTAMAQEQGARLIELADALDDSAASDRLSMLLQRAASGTFQLVVVGEIKKGKSSFINALLGQPGLLPALSDVATSTVYQISWGKQLAYQVHFQPEDPHAPGATTPPPLAIEPAEVAAYGTEDGNPNNRRRVDFIAVTLPHPLLEQGLTIVDTPGLGGLFKSHAEIMWRYAPSADALFFVLDSVEALASRPEMEALARLRRMTPLLYFVQTKTDLAPGEQWREWQTRNLEILADTLQVSPDTLHYFPLSAKLKQAADRRQSSDLLRDSGYAALMEFLQQDLMGNKDAHLASHLALAIQVEADALHQQGAQQLQVLSASSADDLNALDRDAQAARDAFRKWKESKYADLKKDFERRGKTIRRELLHELQNQLDPGSTGPIVGAMMAQLRASERSAEQLVEGVDNYRSELIDRCATEVLAIHQAYQQRMQNLIEQTTGRMDAALQIALEADEPRLAVADQVVPMDSAEPLFERTRVTFRGATTSSAMVWYALAGYSMVFAPVAAVVAVPALIVAIFAGVYFSRNAMEDKRRDKVLAKLQSALAEQVRAAQRQAAHQFHTMADCVECDAADAFHQVMDSRTASLDQQLAQIELSRRQTREQKADRSEALKTRLAQLQLLIQDTAQLQQKTQQAMHSAQAPIDA